MRKIFLGIIGIITIFSNVNISSAKDGLIEDLLNLNYGPFIYNLSLENLDEYNFSDKTLKNTYSTLVSYDTIIREEIIDDFKLGNNDYTKTSAIIRNYKTFISYTNDFFYFLKQIDKYAYLKDDIEIQNGLLNAYKNSQIYYMKVKELVMN